MNIKTDNSAVIATLNKRIAELERYNLGLANESCEQQARIAELKAIIQGRDELINNAVSSGIAELKKERDIRDLEQTRKGFWLGFEDARCHPYSWNILSRWEGTKVFNEAKALKEQGNE
jgi:hypothetical protein